MAGAYDGSTMPAPQPELRRQNQIRTIHASLAIEGNVLTPEQVTAVINQKHVTGPAKDILEVQNALAAYRNIGVFEPLSSKSLLKAHALMMKGLAHDAGAWRAGNVVVAQGERIAHLAPPVLRVPELMRALFDFLEKDQDVHPLLKACVFHYELEFIHPFSDGNGRMGRLWQQVILLNYNPIFEYLPVESLIKEHQAEYYSVLEECDHQGESTNFIEFMLSLLLTALKEFLRDLGPAKHTPQSRLAFAQSRFQNRSFSRKEYRSVFKTISSATASRDLSLGVRAKLLEKTGEKALTRYRFVTVR